MRRMRQQIRDFRTLCYAKVAEYKAKLEDPATSAEEKDRIREILAGVKGRILDKLNNKIGGSGNAQEVI